VDRGLRSGIFRLQPPVPATVPCKLWIPAYETWAVLIRGFVGSIVANLDDAPVFEIEDIILDPG